jgi:hypothetical protein
MIDEDDAPVETLAKDSSMTDPNILASLPDPVLVSAGNMALTTSFDRNS